MKFYAKYSRIVYFEEMFYYLMKNYAEKNIIIINMHLYLKDLRKHILKGIFDINKLH